jgi:DNA-binding response OmpR family regulator
MTGCCILVVEDDPALRSGLVMNLSEVGYTVRAEARGDRALESILADPPDLVLLDLILPGLDGMQVLRRMRRDGYLGPVIILSARDTNPDKIRGLDDGADDYVTKPFDLEELLARVAAALRRERIRIGAENVVSWDDVTVDLAAHRVERAGEIEHLTPREFDLLSFLIRNPGRTYSRADLLESIWGMDYGGTLRTVDNFVRALRVKLERDPQRPEHFVTVRGHGYRFDP